MCDQLKIAIGKTLVDGCHVCKTRKGRGDMRVLLGSLAVVVATFAGFDIAAAAGLGQSEPWQLGLQQAASPSAEGIHTFHNLLMWIISIITIFVGLLLVYVMFRFNEKSNPEPSKTTHNTMIEFVWTVVPILILVGIAIPSFRLLYLQREIPEAALTVKATGNQWYWSYEYPEHKGKDGEAISFDAVIKADDELKEGDPRLLAVDSPIVVPVNKVVKMVVTGADVIHSWTIPSFGAKVDAIPGRLNETWFKAEKVGVYYGQCSEICGKDHAFMPIEVRVVSQADFDKWLETTKTAGLERANTNLIAKMNAETTRKVVELKKQ
jgi:cytochrome c oxidase subunit 2